MASKVFILATVIFLLGLLVDWSCGDEVEQPNNSPGLKVRLSKPGLNYAATRAVQVLSAEVRSIKIPDQSGTAHISIGKVDYEVKNMKVTNFQPPQTTVSVNPKKGLTWSLTGAGIGVHGDWHYKYRKAWIKISDHGSFDADASGISISVSVILGASSAGEPTIKSTGCLCHIDHLNIHIHGGASWFYNLFIKFVEKPVRKSLEHSICDSATKAINTDAAKELATLPVKVVIDKEWILDYRLVAAPQFTSDYMESYHKGEFFWIKDTEEAPFQPAPLPHAPSTDHMVTFWMSDYVLNTAGYVLQKRGLLAYNLTKKKKVPTATLR